MKKKLFNKILTFLFFALCSVLYLQSQNVLADKHLQVKKKLANNYSISCVEQGYFKYKFNEDKKSVTITGYTDNVNNSTLEADKLIIPCEVNYNDYTYPVTVLGDMSFKSSHNKEIEISEGIKEIYFSSFCNNKEMKNISIPSSVEQIYCSNMGEWINYIEKVIVSKKNMKYKSKDDVIYSKDGKTLVCALAVKGEYSVMDGVTQIGDYAFSRNKNIIKVILPQGVVSIGDYAFAESSLKVVQMPNFLISIGEGAFYGDVLLSHIAISPWIKEIKANTFFGCTSLEEIIVPEGVETIGENAFASCVNVSKISLPATLWAFDQTAFDFMHKDEALYDELPLKAADLTLAEENPYFCLKDGAILSKDKTILYKVIVGKTEYTVPSTVTRIMDRCFSNNYNIRYVIINKGITDIPISCFEESSVMYVTLPSTIEVIEENAFLNAELKQINLPKGLKRIEKGAFMGTQLENLSFPSTLEYIGLRALYGLDEIKNLQFFGKKPPVIAIIQDTVTEYVNINVNKAYVPKGTSEAYEAAFDEVPIKVNKIIEVKQKKFKAEANAYAQLTASYIVGDEIGKYMFSLDGKEYKKRMVFNSVTPGKVYVVYAKKGTAVLKTKVKVPSMIYQITSNRIMVIPAFIRFTGYEYRLGDGSWTTDTIFYNLSSDTKYTLYRRKVSPKSKNKNKIIKESFCTKAE